MATGADQPPPALTEEQAAALLADMNDVIRAGDETRRLRAGLIGVLAGLGWTQDRIAGLTGMSQPAVSKQMARHRTDEPPTPSALALDQPDPPWLEGRLLALAETLVESLDDAHCTRLVAALTRGRKQVTPAHVDALRRMVEADLAEHDASLPTRYRLVYDEIGRGLDDPAPRAGTGPASVRRALAHQLQRIRLRADD